MTIYEKYNILLKGRERFYIEDLRERDFVLEGATPVYILIKDKYISERSWVAFLPKLASYLQSINHIDKELLLNYKTTWSKSSIYSTEKRINYKHIFDDLYINTNHTAIHSVWLIQDLLIFYGVDIAQVTLVIKRPPSIEPVEVKNYIKKEMKEMFASYLYGKKIDVDKISVIVNNIEALNKLLGKMSKSYDDFFLFDNSNALSNYKSKLLKSCEESMLCNEKQLLTIKKHLNLFTNFCSVYFNG